MRTTPSLLVRTALYALLVELLVVLVLASAVPRGGAFLTRLGFVTPYYDRNVFAIRIVAVPWTDPALYLSVQTALQMLAVAMAAAALITLVRTNPWHHGALPEPPAAPKERSGDKPAAVPRQPAAGGPTPAPSGPANAAGSP